VFPFVQGGPLMHAVAAKAVAFAEAQKPEFRAYGRQVVANARALSAALAKHGLRPVSGGTDTHMVILDLRSLPGARISGRDAELRCERAKIMLNRSSIPYDSEKPMITSGMRVGTAAVTSQGMGEAEMEQIARMVARAIQDAQGRSALEIAEQTAALTARFPLYDWSPQQPRE
jgi:glycine hydroxymethyltransferase